MTPPSRQQIDSAVRRALEEDLSLGDLTTTALFPKPIPARGTIVAQHPMTVAGIAVARRVFAQVDPSLRILRSVRDGARVGAKTEVLVVQGDARSLLMAERVALNFLQRLSGIATLTARFCEAIRGSRATIMDTRKTTPGLRTLEKWAVALGGGHNHRRCLGDGILIKDNHLALLRGLDGDLTSACRLARAKRPAGMPVEAEAKTLAEVREALAGGADIILLDNMKPALIKRSKAIIKNRASVEISGGITLKNIVIYSRSGADRISIGALTHSVQAADLSMDIAPLTRRLRTTRSRDAVHRRGR